MTVLIHQLPHGRISVLALDLAERLKRQADDLKAAGGAPLREIEALAALSTHLDSLGRKAWNNDFEAVEKLCSLLDRADLLQAYEQERIRAKLDAIKAARNAPR